MCPCCSRRHHSHWLLIAWHSFPPPAHDHHRFDDLEIRTQRKINDVRRLRRDHDSARRDGRVARRWDERQRRRDRDDAEADRARARIRRADDRKRTLALEDRDMVRERRREAVEVAERGAREARERRREIERDRL